MSAYISKHTLYMCVNTKVHSEQVFTTFGKKPNVRSSTWYCKTPLYSTVYIQFHGSLRWLHLQETPSQNFIKRLKQRRLGADFARTGRVFRYLTWSGLVVFVLDSLNQIKENVSYKSWIKVVYIVLYVSKHRKCNLTIVIVFCFALSKKWE